MNSLVLGGNGFIGSHLVDRLLEAGHKVAVFDKQPEAYRAPLEGVAYHQGAFGDGKALAGALDGAEAVFHLIHTTLPKTSVDDPGHDALSNLVPTLGLLDACVKRKVRIFVFISSGGTVYGNPAGLPLREDSPKQPLSSYGVTKLAIEQYLAFYEHQFGLECRILRPSNPYGPRQNPQAIQGAIPVFLRKMRLGEPIEIWGDGSVVRDYVYVTDLAEGIRLAAATPTRQRVFNLGSGEGLSLKDLLGRIQRVTGLKPEIRHLPARPFDIQTNFLDIGRARAELGWRPGVGLDEGIARTWEFVKGIA